MVYVSMVYLKNDKGFIFISLLLSLVTAIITIPLLISVLQMNLIDDMYDHHSVNSFYYLIQNELLIAKDYNIHSDSLTILSTADEKIKFSKYNNVIRKQVNSRGHEIYLRDVKDFLILPLDFGFKIIIETLKGDIYGKSFSFYNF